MDVPQFCLEHNNSDEEEGISLLKCLCMCLSDEEGKLLVKRHLVLMNQYLYLRRSGIKTIDLPFLMMPLEFFSENSTDEQQYYRLILQCFNLLLKPILLSKSSDACSAADYLKDFFSSIGNCLHIASNYNIESTIIDVILFLITYKEKIPQEVTLEIRLKAVENSFLPEIIVSFMYFMSEELYEPLLGIMYQLSLQPLIATLFQLLRCTDYWLRKVAIKNFLSMKEASIKETTSNLLWSIMRSHVKFENEPEPTLNSESLSILRGWLRREVLFGQPYERNNIAALLLQTLINIPNLEISRSGILEDIGLLAVATEFGTDHTWANKVTFKPTRDDLDFKKILITILTVMNEDLITKMVLLSNRFINCLAWILDLRNCKGSCPWNQGQRLELINFALYTLPIFSKHFKELYTRSGATTRILELIDFFTYKQPNLRLVKNCCLCLHLLVSQGINQQHFRVLKVTEVLINLIFYSLQCLKLNLLVQTIITYSLCTITNIIQDHRESKQSLATELNDLYNTIFNRFQKPIKSDTKISNSLLISAIDFVWQCVVLNEMTNELFFESLGVYSVFNIMEEAPFVVQLICLSLVSDLCDEPKSIPQIVTWRGKDRSNSFFKMMCDLWRKQEQMKGVLRDEYGCIEDMEYSLMGQQQQLGIRSEDVDISTSPALVDMIGCVRPKIALAVHFMKRRHFEKVRLATSIYNAPFDNGLAPEDEITLQIILCYEELKMGEILWEVQRAVDKVGVKLLPLDVEILHQLIMRLIGLANKVQRSQRSILKTMRNKELGEEHKIYKEIEEYKLATTMKELCEKDSYLTVSNKLYRKWKYDQYEKFLNTVEQLYADKKDKNFHQTFYHPRNFIAVKTGRDAHIISIKRKKESSRMSFYDEEVPGDTNSDTQSITNEQ